MSEKAEKSPLSLKRVVFSTLTLILAFILTKLLLHGMIYMLCNTLGYEPSFSFNNVSRVQDPRKWSQARVFIVNAIPTIMCLLLGAGLYVLMRRQKRSWGGVQYFAFWLMICLLNVFFAQLLFAPLGVDDIGSTFYQTLAIVEAWLLLPVPVASAITVASIVVTAATGYYLSVEAVKLSHSQRLVAENEGKNIIIIQLYLLPLALALGPLLLLGKGLYTLPLAAAIINLALFPVGMFLRNSRSPYRVRFQKTGASTFLLLVFAAITIALWLVVYVNFR